MLGGVGRYLRSSPMLRVNARAQDQMPIHSGRRPLPSPSPLYSRISCPPPTDGPPRTPAQQDSTQDCTEAALSSAVQRSAPPRSGDHALHPTPALPHQRFYVRVMLESIDGLRYRLGLHRLDPPPQQSPPPNVYHHKHVYPSIHQLHSLTHLHSTTTPYPPNRPPQTHSHLIGKAKNRLRTHPRSGKGSTQAPFFHTLCTSRSAFS